jgi:hypothetical protein
MNPLRKLFGPSRETVWRQLCTELGVDYVKGGLFEPDKVEVRHGEWTILLDTYVVSTGKTVIVFTRMRAPYVNPDGFRFTVYRRGFFSDVAKWFGMQDVEVGHAEFDRDFIIKGTSETRLRALFDDQRLRELIAVQPQIHFTVKDDEGRFGPSFPEHTDELCFHVPGTIKDTVQLKRLFDLFAEALDRLCRIGSAYEGDPGLKL